VSARTLPGTALYPGNNIPSLFEMNILKETILALAAYLTQHRSERREKAVDTRRAPLGARRRTWTVR
jgi:hypothetical protein